MDDQEWRETRRDANRTGRLVLLWVVIGVLAAGVIGVAIWLFNVTTSDVKGQGDAERMKNAGTNRVEKQAEFNDRYQGILRLDRQINDAKTAWDVAPNDATLRTNYLGLMSNCQTAVGEYNSLARKYLAEEFRDTDLPSEINQNDSTTDCKPDPKPATTTPEVTR